MSALAARRSATCYATLDEGIEQMKSGQTVDVADALAELRARL
jgi:hypothetical protein